jgi:hypothetical protein
MYLLIFALVPVLYLFNPRLAMAGLIVAIVVMYIQRTRPPKRPRRASESEYRPGYED